MRPVIDDLPDRMPAIDPAAYDAEQRDAADRLIATPRGEVRGPFIPLLRSPELLDRSQALGAFLRYRCSVPERLRELAILATALHWRQPYEWLAHVGPGVAAGLSAEALDRLAEGEDATSLLREDERIVQAFVLQVHRGGQVDDPTYAAALHLLDERGLVDLLGLCGYYSLLAMVMNVARTACRDPTFPTPR
jgi:4-carboxymuconolactone decarboxylase